MGKLHEDFPKESSKIHLKLKHKRKGKQNYSFPAAAKSMLLSIALVISMGLVGLFPASASPLETGIEGEKPAVIETVSKENTSMKAVQAFQVSAVDDGVITRMAGTDRYATAAVIARKGWQQSDHAIIAYGGNFPDALAAAPLSYKYDAPILLTTKNTLTGVTETCLKDLGVKEVFVVGGEGVISEAVVGKIESLGIKTKRLAGLSRYDTSIEIAEEVNPNPKEVFVATGGDYADALSIGSIAGSRGVPVILVPKDNVPDSVANYIRRHDIEKTYIIGGTDLISDSVANIFPNPHRIDGSNKYERNIAVLELFSSEFKGSEVAVATGENFADALTGSAYATKNHLPIVLLPEKQADVTNQYFKDNDVDRVNVFGGEAVVPSDRLTSYFKGKAGNYSTSETQVVLRLNTASKFVYKLYKSGNVSTLALNQLTQRLLEIEDMLNSSSIEYGENLIKAIKDTDKMLSDLDLNKSRLVVTAGAEKAFDKAVDAVSSVKSKLESSNGSTVSDNGRNVVYVRPITQYGQSVFDYPVEGAEKIEVLYGRHTYGCNNQEEYDAVIEKVKGLMKDVAKRESMALTAIRNYKKGVASDMEKVGVEKAFLPFLDYSNAELERLFLGYDTAGSIGEIVAPIPNASALTVGESAYNFLMEGHGDCNALAYTFQVIFDLLGYNTRVRATSGHAWCEVKLLDGKWYVLDGGLEYMPVRTASGFTLIEPTYPE